VSDYDPVAFGRLEERVEGLVKGQEKVSAQLETIIDKMNQLRGAKWAVGSFIAVIASGGTHLLHKWLG